MMWPCITRGWKGDAIMQVSEKFRSADELVLAVLGTIDAKQANAFYDEVVAWHNKKPDLMVVLDIEGVDYITSAGLRSLLKLRQDFPLRIENTTPEVMEIFEMTKFTRIIEISKKIRTVSLEGCKLVGKGANGEVYRLDGETVVKLFAKGTPLSDVEKERDRAQQALIYGIPTAITFDVVRADGRYGTVFELVNADSLSHVLRDNPDEFDRYATQYVNIFKSFHATHVSGSEFTSVKDTYHGYIDGCRDWYDTDQVDLLHAVVDSVPNRDTLTHGDYHANNILVADGELIMIDMGDMSYGHPMFDFLATAATQANLVDLNPAYAEIHTQMPVQMIKRLWNYLLDHYFTDKTKGEIAAIDAQIRLFTKLKVALAPVVGRGIPQELMEASVTDAKENFLTRSNELIGAIDW